MRAPTRLDVVLIEDKDVKAWTARCLQHDIAAQGDSPELAMQEFQRVFAVEIVYGVIERGHFVNPLADVPKAPESVWRLRDEAETPDPRLIDRLPNTGLWNNAKSHVVAAEA